MQPKIITINSNHGLPNDQIHAATNDKYGRLWLAGPSGLSCYDGVNLNVFDSRNGINCPGLRTILISKNDIIWIGTDRGIEAMHIDGTIIELKLQFEWNYGIVESILILNSYLWLGTSFGLLKIGFSKNKLKLIQEEELGLVSNLMKNGDDSLLLISAKKGLLEFTNNETQLFKSTIPLNIKPNCFTKTIDNNYLIGTPNGLYHLDNNKNIINHYSPINGTQKVTKIKQIGTEYAVTFNKNLHIFKQNFKDLIEIEIINIDSKINDIFRDRFKNIWVCTNNSGLKKISYLRNTIKRIECGSNDAAFSINYLKSKKNIFVGGSGFFSQITKNKKSNIPLLVEQHDVNTIVWDSIQDPKDENTVWLATEDGIYISKNNSLPKKEETIAQKITSPNRVLLRRKNEIWIGTISGLYCIKDNEVIEILNKKNEKFGYVYCLNLNQNKEIWVGTLGQGLWLETENGFKSINDHLLIKDGNTYSVKTNEENKTIVIQQENIILLDENLNSELIYQEFPLGGWTFEWINNYTIATGSSDGICLIDIQNKKLLKRINLYLDKSEWQFTSTRALKKISDNILFCCLNSGLYTIDLNKISNNIKQPEVFLNYCNWENKKPTKFNNEYFINTGNWTVEISVFSTWFIDENKINFRYKLSGFDENWSVLSESGKIRFNSLPVGKYTLLVQAYTPLTGFSAVKKIAVFNVEYYFINFLNSFREKLNTLFSFFSKAEIKKETILNQNEHFLKELNERKFIEEELNNYKEHLEELVEERTEDLKKEKEKAESADKMKTAFLANMSHEIRTPLSGIISLNKLLSSTSTDTVQKEYISKIENSSDHLLEIVNNILDISKIEAGQFELEKIPFSLNKLIDDVAEFSQIKHSNKPVNIIIDKNVKSKDFLVGDPLRIKQVLFNLLSNSIKFTSKGNIILSIRQLNSPSSKIILQFTVSDTGIGMTQKHLKGLFKAYNQGNATISRKYGGTGLGLNISYKFVELMGGIINVSSDVDKGSKFTFTLNLEKYDDLEMKEGLFNLPENILSKKILLIDNNIINAKNIEKISKQLNLNFTKTNISSIDKYANQKFDAVFVSWSIKQIEEKIELINKLFCSDDTKLIILGNTYKDLQLINNESYKISKVILLPVTINSIYKVLLSIYVNNISSDKKSAAKSILTKTDTLKKRILVAEDNLINQMVIKKILEGENFNLKIVNNGKECIEELNNKESYDLILMDIMMPILNGIEATKYIREELKNKAIPIIALTADANIMINEDLKSYGFNDYILKPIDLEDLRVKLKNSISI
jgi:signal transduction histidine kinase/CheY-like chemotaxis protein/ligand-binding sensor domain-containing protein